MSKRNAVEKSKFINEQYKKYLLSTFNLGKGELQKQFEQAVEEERLFKGPYINMTLPFKRGASIRELIKNGTVADTFAGLNEKDATGNFRLINLDRRLYVHQEQALKRVKSGKSVVVTTGTGSGKTECFLYPIINEILDEIKQGNTEKGIRAMFLYPMNALINDQVERIRTLLHDSSITFGFFTGETKESVGKNFRTDNGIMPNELVSREEIRENPPHLLFTNYSMLEYLLIRPSDTTIFDEEHLKNWKYVVLDEAHTYRGSLGIELSMLLRRVTGLAPVRPRFILTSATIGDKGKSEGQILEFASRLTSADFHEEDIIFADRIPFDCGNGKYQVSADDYKLLKDNFTDKKSVESIVNRYIDQDLSELSCSEMLYCLLRCDRNVIKLYEILSSGKNDWIDVKHTYMSENGIEDEAHVERELTDLIDLVNDASDKDGIGLFELRYHSFVRPLYGAYVTFGENKNLTLKKVNEINGLKAFEIGNCRFCGSKYIIGKKRKNKDGKNDGIDYLYQNSEIDIYENFAEDQAKNFQVDYYLIHDGSEEQGFDDDLVEESVLCTKCGAVYEKSNLKSKKCSCGQKYEMVVYHIKRDTNSKRSDDFYNNVKECPCCGHKSKSGIVKALNLGKDEGTAIIAQLLYDAIDEHEDDKIERPVKDIFATLGESRKSMEGKGRKCKQFLCFSDSRQQASFFATFFDNNYSRMLRKRLIWEVIKNKNYGDISYGNLVSYISNMIRVNGLFGVTNEDEATREAEITILRDLLKVDGNYDGEGLGLYYFDLNLSDIEKQIKSNPKSFEDKILAKYGISEREFILSIKILLDGLKEIPAIISPTFPLEVAKKYLGYRRFHNYVMLKLENNAIEKNVRSFLPRQNENSNLRFVKKALGFDKEKAIEFMRDIFDICSSEAVNILRRDTNIQSPWYQIPATAYILKNSHSSEFFQCDKCGKLTPYNLRGVCTHDGCDGHLKSCNVDDVLCLNYYRNEYMNKKIERMIVKEHTAQLDHTKAKEYQEAFKNFNINILSCSTTFEMGIDIGSLETVFMRNIPPTPANYAQRAGRAGRSRESSAYVITYCGIGSHDYTYFDDPMKVINGVVKPPYFDIANRKIIMRHLLAICLGLFFKKYPLCFENIEKFLFEKGDNGEKGIDKFIKYICGKPLEVDDYVSKKVLPEEQFKSYHGFDWVESDDGLNKRIRYFRDIINDAVSELTQSAEAAKNDSAGCSFKAYCNKQIESIKSMKLLDALSKYCIIPKYGFPVDVVELEIYEHGFRKDTFNLARDLKIAISEYAPDSEVIVDNEKYTSKYIALPYAEEVSGQLPKYYYYKCDKCGKITVQQSNESYKCKYCGFSRNSSVISDFFMDPIRGFRTGKNKESATLKPKRTYAGEVQYIGGGKKDEQIIEYKNVMTIETSSDDQLFVKNRSKFFMCERCGYAKKANSGDKRLFDVEKDGHETHLGRKCTNKKLRRIEIGHCFRTDVARFRIPAIQTNYEKQLEMVLSFMYAFLEGISTALNIDRNDIDGVIDTGKDNIYDILIFDNVPGGAGHVKRLANAEAIQNSLRYAKQKVSQECCDKDTSCYNCLRNYYNQQFHSKLQRGLALECIDKLLLEIVKHPPVTKNTSVPDTQENAKPLTEVSAVIEKLLTEHCSDREREIINSMIDYANNAVFTEKPEILTKVGVTGYYPNLVWHKSRVAWFLHEQKETYDLFRKEKICSEWHAYMIEDAMSAENLFEFVERK